MKLGLGLWLTNLANSVYDLLGISNLFAVANAQSGLYSEGGAQFASVQKDYLYCNSNSSQQPGNADFEVGCWVKFNASPSTFMGIVAKGSGSNAATEYLLYWDNTIAKFRLFLSDGVNNNSAAIAIPGGLVVGTWYFVRGWYDAAADLIYISINNGTPVTQSYAFGCNSVPAQPLTLGGYASSGTFNGVMDSAYFRKQISTSGEATWLYNSGAGRKYEDISTGQPTFLTNLISWWNLYQDYGTRYDSHGSNHLTPSAYANLVDATTANGGFETLLTQTNILLNPGFETAGGGGADLWANWVETANSSIFSDETTTVHGGSHAAKMTWAAGSRGWIGQTITVAANTRYTLQFWAYGTAQGSISVYDQSNGVFIIPTVSFTPSVSWGQYWQTFTTPATCTSIQIFLYAPPASGYVIYDDASVFTQDPFSQWTVSSNNTFQTYCAVQSTPISGTYSARMFAPTGGYIALYKSSQLIVGNRYKITVKAKASSGTPQFSIRDSAGTTTYVTFTSSTTTTTYTVYINATTTSIAVVVAGGSIAIDFDDFTLVSLGPVGVLGLVSAAAVDSNFSAQFSGSNYLSAASNAGLQAGTSQFSAWGWIFLDNKPSSGYATAFGKYSTTGNKREWCVAVSSVAPPSDRIYAFISSDGISPTVSLAEATIGSPNVGQWYFVVISYDKTNLNLYVNDNAGSSSASSIDIYAGTSAFAIGAMGDALNPFQGRIDSVGYLKGRVLTPTERTALYNKGFGLKYAQYPSSITSDSGLVSAWDLEESTGITADQKGSNTLTNNGSVSGAKGVGYYTGWVSRWIDQYTTSRAYTQSNSLYNPAYVAQALGTNKKPALYFNGLRSQLGVASDIVGTGDVTVFAVIRPFGLGGGNFGRIIDNGQFDVNIATGPILQVNSSGGATTASSGSISVNTSYVICVTRTSAGVTNIYVNNVLSGTANQSSGTPGAGGNTYIGNKSDLTRGFNGYIGYVDVIKRIVTSQERGQISTALSSYFGGIY